MAVHEDVLHLSQDLDMPFAWWPRGSGKRKRWVFVTTPLLHQHFPLIPLSACESIIIMQRLHSQVRMYVCNFSHIWLRKISLNHPFSHLYCTLKSVRSFISWSMAIEWLSSLLFLSPLQVVRACSSN
jgi:hypothetical protein